MRQGALPATMAAPMTSSEDLPAGICSAVTFWSGFAVFQAATTCSPQATSCSLLEYQILIGPTAEVASPAATSPLPPAMQPRPSDRSRSGTPTTSRRAPGASRLSPPGTPVSYTHLRAHETDSYLVCRLLL